ncbi:MAG: hypothetical protein LBV41_00405 [Cytophagaceae bacterium]|jgi:hypothetical protein|nr:hypothetical protein [Cytophagaceae bacterium]
MKKNILFFVLVCILAGCEEHKPISGAVFSKSFIQVYVTTVDSFGVQGYNDDAIRMWIKGENIDNVHDALDEAFKSISKQFGDTCYNRDVVPFINKAIIEEFFINIACNKDFNDYPAGASLNEVVEFIGSSAYEYVKSGYVNESNWTEELINEYGKYTGIKRYGYHLVVKKLSELTVPDTKLLDPTWMYLNFLEKPSSGEYVFTVTVKTEDKVLQEDITVIF